MVLISAFEHTYGIYSTRTDVIESSDERVLIRIVDGAGRAFGLKARPPWISAPDFEVTLSLQELAIRNGAQIPSVVRTINGRSTWEWEGREFTVHEWVEGDALGWSLGDSRALGQAVGAFSVSTASMNANQVGDWTFPNGRERWLPDTPSQLRSICRFIKAVPPRAATFDAIEQIAEFARESISIEDLPTGFIHGDVSPLNAVQKSGQATLIDLDAMRWGFRLFDAVQGVATVAGLDPGRARPTVRSNWDYNRARAFLTGWSGEVRPSTVEIDAFPSFLKLALIRVVVGELDLDDPALPTRGDARSSIEALLRLLHAPVPTLASVVTLPTIPGECT